MVNETLYTSGEWNDKPNAIDALYSFEPETSDPRHQYEISSGESHFESEGQILPKIPILISEGLQGALSLDTGANKDAFIELRGVKYQAEVVGLISKMPGTSFTSYSVGSSLFSFQMSGYSSFSLGQGVITTDEAVKAILED